jgi:hypothetical protein
MTRAILILLASTSLAPAERLSIKSLGFTFKLL